VMAVQVTDAKERSVELRFLMSAGNPTTTFDLRCYVRERLIQYLQQHYSSTIHRHLREFVPRSRWLMQVRRDRALG